MPPQRIQRAGAIRQLASRLGIGNFVPDLLHEDVQIVAVLEVGGDEIVSCVGTGQIGPIAGNNSHIELYNPLTSNVLIRVLSIAAGVTAAAQVSISGTELQAGGAAGTVAVINPFRGQGTLKKPRAPTGQVRTANFVGISGVTISREWAPANDAKVLTHGLIELEPGQGIFVANATANAVLETAFVWKEIPVGQSDR